MIDFLNKMKQAAAQAKIKDHPLILKNISMDIRSAFFSAVAASAYFLDNCLEEEEKNFLTKLGLSLHFNVPEINELLNGVQIDDDSKMPFLEDMFGMMNTDYLKYSLLIEIYSFLTRNGTLDQDEREFLQFSSDILLKKDFMVSVLAEKKLTWENLDEFIKNGSMLLSKKEFYFQKRKNEAQICFNEIKELIEKNPNIAEHLEDESWREIIAHLENDSFECFFLFVQNNILREYPNDKQNITLELSVDELENIREGLKDEGCLLIPEDIPFILTIGDLLFFMTISLICTVIKTEIVNTLDEVND